MSRDRYRRALASVVKALSSRGIDSVLIGSAVLTITYNIENYDPGDIDLFITNASTVTQYELFEEIARENDWDIGNTMHGTVFYEVLVGGELIRVDLLENILDIYVPTQMIENALRIEVDGVEAKSIRLEDQLLLKARSETREGEEFIAWVAEKVAEGSLRLDTKYLTSALNYFSGEERESIAKRLRKNGIYID